jgi:hypothetical protein
MPHPFLDVKLVVPEGTSQELVEQIEVLLMRKRQEFKSELALLIERDGRTA